MLFEVIGSCERSTSPDSDCEASRRDAAYVTTNGHEKCMNDGPSIAVRPRAGDPVPPFEQWGCNVFSSSPS